MNSLFFALVIFQRGLSGLVNSYGYSKKINLLIYGSLLLFIANVLIPQFYADYYLNNGGSDYLGINILMYGFVIISVIGVLGVMFSFKKIIPSKIHTYEVLTTTGFTFAMYLCNYNVIDLILAVSPGMVLHKGFINLSTNRPFIDKNEITNDPTGKTYYLEILDMDVPRIISKGNVRLVLAGLSIVLFVLNEMIFNVSFTFVNLLELVKIIK